MTTTKLYGDAYKKPKYLPILPLKVTRKAKSFEFTLFNEQRKNGFGSHCQENILTHKGEVVKLGQGVKTYQIYLASL